MGAPTWPPNPQRSERPGTAAAPLWIALRCAVYLPICFSRYAFTCGVIGYGSSPLGPNHLS
jgi:hypothetical protein